MKAAILTNNADSFYKPLAEGLSRMFNEIGVDSLILYNGLASLPRQRIPENLSVSSWKDQLGWYIQKCKAHLAYRRLIRELNKVDFAIIISHVPRPYLESFFDDKRLRNDVAHLPIILYDLVYLPTRGNWAKSLLKKEAGKHIPPGQHWGIERYDHHLCVTEISEYPMPPGAEKFSRVGVNLVDPTLFIEPKDSLVALIDFERPDNLQERAVQVQACIDANIPFKVLHGHYPIDEIRAIYRSCSLYFVAHRESFGLPICEVQACGGMVLTPYADWCPSHYLAIPEKGEIGCLPDNFIVYNNDKDRLVEELNRLKQEYNAEKVLANYQQEQPHFYYGDTKELEKFVNLVKEGKITSSSHKQYPDLKKLVQVIDDIS